MAGAAGLQKARAHEPIFSAPWPALAIVAAIVAGYALQPPPNSPEFERLVAAYALTPAQLAQGRAGELFTHMFLHGGWPHALFNAMAALIFATPVARLLGTSLRGALAFFAFYLLCGAIAAALYCWADLASASVGGVPGFHVSPLTPIIGASGAISGLAGAAARLFEGGDRPGPIRSRLAVGMAAAWVVTNLVIGLLGFAPGTDGAQLIAWQVHILGFFVGLVLIGPWAALFARRGSDAESGAPAPFGGR